MREAMQVLHESQLAEADHLAFTEFLRDLFAVKKLGNWMEEADEAENEMVSKLPAFMFDKSSRSPSYPHPHPPRPHPHPHSHPHPHPRCRR